MTSKNLLESVSGPLVKNNSNFYPPCKRNKFLDTTTDFINQLDLNNLSINKTNLSKEDWQPLEELKIDISVVIKEANKGGTIIIMDFVHYEQMIYKQLEDKTHIKNGSIL